MQTSHTKPSKAYQAPSLFLVLAAILLAWLATPAPVHAQTNGANTAAIEIVTLQYRDADSVREAITPFLDPRGALSQIDNKLIISTSTDNLSQLKSLITELDVPRQRLRISVDFQYADPNQTQAGGSTIATTSTLTHSATIRSLVLSEGEYAYFSTNSDTPSVSSVLTDQGLLLNQAQSPEGSSFAVSAQRRGSRFYLELSTLQSQSDDELVTTARELNTRIEIDPNLWYVLNESSETSADGTKISTAETSELIAIKVELMP
jgi:hypothetical protein